MAHVKLGLLALAALLAVSGLGQWGLRGELSMSSHKPAPEFEGISRWLNSPPLTIESLRGKTVLVQFWTFSCINWLRTLPYVAKWQESYKDKGFVVIGVHSPEFAFEKETRDVEGAIKRFGITYPVAQDNQFETWKAYGNQYWPAQYLIDKSGKVVMTQFGEGNYRQMDIAIAKLVGADLSGISDDEPDQLDFSDIGSPEMYFGAARNGGAVVDSQSASVGTRLYTVLKDIPLNRFALSGTWTITGESATLAGDGGEITLRFRAPKVNLVAGSASAQTLLITVDGKPQPPVTVKDSQLYVIYDGYDGAGVDHVLRLIIPKAGLSAYTFTFG